MFTLKTIVEKFGEEMAPYDLGLWQNLAATIWRCMNTAEPDDEAALAAAGCLHAISTILESVSGLLHLFVQVEPTLLPIMRRMLTTDGQGLCVPLFFCLLRTYFIDLVISVFIHCWNFLQMEGDEKKANLCYLV